MEQIKNMRQFFGIYADSFIFYLNLNILWGFLFWQEVPTWVTLAGALLTLSSGLYVLYRERK